jgi:hypothetical protein
MRFVRSLLVGLRALVDKHGRNAEIDEELEAYIGESVSEKMRAGMSLKEAVKTARAEVGSAEVVKHKVWSAGWESLADRLWGDVMYSLRRLSHAKALVFTVMVSIGLGNCGELDDLLAGEQVRAQAAAGGRSGDAGGAGEDV